MVSTKVEDKATLNTSHINADMPLNMTTDTKEVDALISEID